MKINDFNIIQYNERKNVYFDKKHYYWFNDDYFIVSDVKSIANSNIYLRRTKLANLAELKVIEIHDFRHSCASLLIYKVANIITVSKFLGHTKIEETLNTYTHLYKNALTDITSLIDDMNN